MCMLISGIGELERLCGLYPPLTNVSACSVALVESPRDPTPRAMLASVSVTFGDSLDCWSFKGSKARSSLLRHESPDFPGGSPQSHWIVESRSSNNPGKALPCFIEQYRKRACTPDTLVVQDVPFRHSAVTRRQNGSLLSKRRLWSRQEETKCLQLMDYALRFSGLRYLWLHSKRHQCNSG